MDAGQWLVIGLSLVMGVWYVAAASLNRRRGIVTYHWLRAGLESLGKVSEARWIGSSGSGARLVVGNARSPFRRVETVFLLETREILPLWAVNRLRGKRDEMIIKAALRRVPRFEIEVAPTGDRQAQALLEGQSGGGSFRRLEEVGNRLILVRGTVDSAVVDGLMDFLQHFGDAILRVSLQRRIPHLVVRVALPDLRSQPGEEFFTALQGWLAPAPSQGVSQ